jgi:adenine-specific DNA-methyltransferase
MSVSNKKGLGQYFTVSPALQQFVFDKVRYKGARLLEPSFGAGHLLKKFIEYDPAYPASCYELDSTVKPVVVFVPAQTIIYGDFTKQAITEKFRTIIGNPPYVKQSTGNLYIKFIEQCFDLLEADGEMIFIVPSDFIKLTSAAAIIDRMKAQGSFTDFLFPHDEKLFQGASVDVLVFRYEKGLQTNQVVMNGKNMLCNINNGIVTFSDTEVLGTPLSSRFHVYVGLVSGKDTVYCSPIGNMDILCDKGKQQKFIFTETYPTADAAINTHLLAHKPALLERKIRKFNETNWYEWGAPRNIVSMRANQGKPCIYMRTMTRNQEVCFIGTVQYFGGTLLCLIPKTDISETELARVADFLNSKDMQKDYIYSGRFKIGQKQVCNIIMPS